jgi:hypothetical protein
MSRRSWIVPLLVVVFSAPLQAQLTVFDGANLTQAVLIAHRAQQHYEELQAQYRTIMRMARALENLDGFRIPTIPITHHDTSQWSHGQAWLRGLNAGDPTGSGYWATAVPLQPPTSGLDRLPSSARRLLERQYATIEVADSVALMAGHQVGALRGYHAVTQRAVQDLESDVMNPLPRFHEITTILDKIAGGELIGRRQDMASNQLLSHALEQLLVRSKRMRDTEASIINMQLVTWRDGRDANAAFIAGSGDALRAWRQP